MKMLSCAIGVIGILKQSVGSSANWEVHTHRHAYIHAAASYSCQFNGVQAF